MFDESALRAADLMTTDIAVVHPETPLRRAVQIMAARHVSGLPVVDGTGALIGMITEGDLARWHEDFPEHESTWLDMLGEGFELAPTFVEALRAERHSVHAAMRAGPVVTVPESMPAREIATLMHARGIKHVPVLRDGRMVGIVTRSDLVRALGRALDAAEADRARGALPPRPGT